MSAAAFPHLFSEAALGRTVVRKRIASAGHHTHQAHGAPGDRQVVASIMTTFRSAIEQ